MGRWFKNMSSKVLNSYLQVDLTVFRFQEFINTTIEGGNPLTETMVRNFREASTQGSRNRQKNSHGFLTQIRRKFVENRPKIRGILQDFMRALFSTSLLVDFRRV